MRIAGVNIVDSAQVQSGLTAVYGIGRSLSEQICRELNIDPYKKVSALTESEDQLLRAKLETLKIEGDLRSSIQQYIKHQTTMNSYRGIRHAKKLPVRGQRTKTNARTKRGKKITVGSGRKPTAQKT
ncbi:MAG: 30S ribosomal protein S13 [bacterium]|nr:30S ribosomal protein S13 [bacterium]